MASKWTTVNVPNASSGSFKAGTMLLMTDGSVMVHNDTSPEWMRLTPGSDPTQPGGIYANGSWSQPQSMNSIREYYASGVLPDGRMYVVGAEYSDNSGNPNNLKDGETYDPATNTWKAISKPSPAFDFVQGDVSSCVLPDGRVLLGGAVGGSTQTAIWDPTDDSWVVAGLEFGAVASSNKQGGTDEETWTLMPDGSVVTVEIAASGNAEKYLPSSDKWVSAGTAPSQLALTTNGSPAVTVNEIGPALVLPSGQLLAIGGTGATALYTPNSDVTQPGTWTAGPSLPKDSSNNQMTALDAPGVLTPGGRVICSAGSTTATRNSAGTVTDYFSQPTTLVEWDPASSVTTMPALSSPPPVTNVWTYQGRFLVLPTGQIMYSANQGNAVYIYTPDSTDGTPAAAWAPVITGFPSALIVGHSYTLTGHRFNGISQGASYGDDAQMATNYPIVQVTETATGSVSFLRSSGFSTMGIAKAGDTATASCEVQVPYGLDPGAYQLVVIANGIPSLPVEVQVGTRDCFINLERDTYSKGDVAGVIAQHSGAPAVYTPGLFVVVEGFTPSELGINNPSDLANPGVVPALSSSEGSITAQFVGPVKPEDPTLPDAPQRFTYEFSVTFADTSAFGFAGAEFPVVLEATLSAANSSVGGPAVIELLQSADPIILHGDQQAGLPWYLSVDLRVVQVNAGNSLFGATVASSGAAQTAATQFIQRAIGNLNGVGVSAAVKAGARNDFNSIQQAEDLSQLTLAPDDGHGNRYYNFGLARVRLRDTLLDADNVALFFRLWPAQQTNAAYDQSTTYRRGTNPAGKTVPLLGVSGDEIVSIPFFAEPRVSASQPLTAQADTHNRHAVIAHDSSGGEVDTYFGCWLDINQPSDDRFPQRILGVGKDGPFDTVSPLFPVQQLVRSDHCCLLAEIEIDGQPHLISNQADPSSSDKLAQRNVTFVGIPNPGVLASRRAPQTFEVKPTISPLPTGQQFDELMIDWGNVPDGAEAEIFLPAVSAEEILSLAGERYVTHRLTKVDDHTVRIPAGGIGWVPIPPYGNGNLAGLLTIDFPASVKKGNVHTVVLRQVTTSGLSAREATAEAVQRQPTWRRVIGSFALVMPVSTKAELLPGAERQLSLMRWIGKAVPGESRWWPVFQRYLVQLGARVGALGGDPAKVPATGTGSWPGWIGLGHGQGEHGGHGVGHGGPHHHPEPHHHLDHFGHRHAGKVIALRFDRFGDFDGFSIETYEGHELTFRSREHPIERLARRAWRDRLEVVVAADPGDHWVAGLELRGVSADWDG